MLRFAIYLALFLSGSFATAQSSLWQHVTSTYHPPRLSAVSVSDSQHKAISRLLRRQGKGGLWECEGDELDEMLNGLTFEPIPLSPGRKILLVQAGQGCARGGQGANGAMWLVRFAGKTPVLLASPEEQFNGWLHSIQDSASHGYRDIVLGWHMSAFEADLSYFRFDGKTYRRIGTAVSTNDDGDRAKIVPSSH